MKSWQVTYTATYFVEAVDEDEALEVAMEAHSDIPDGSWEVELDTYNSNNYNTLGEK